MTKIKTTRASGVLVLILALVNGAAVWGQAGWALENIVPAGWTPGAGLALSLAFAAAIELIGVFLAMMADQGEDVGLPSGGVRLGSYAVGLVSGSLNFSHWYASGVSAAIAFGFLSAVSPFLWGIWSRVRRGRLSPPSRRFWHPLRSLSLIRAMAWEGVSDENEAVRTLVRGHVRTVEPAADADTDVRRVSSVRGVDMPDSDAVDRAVRGVLGDFPPDTSTGRPVSELDAWEQGYEDALSTVSAQLADEVDSYVSAFAAPLPKRTRTSAGMSVPADAAELIRAWEPAALSAGDMTRLLAASFGVSTRTVTRWRSAVLGPVSGPPAG